MITYIFDGTKNGLFTCIFESFYAREIPDDVSNEAYQTGLFDINKTIMTDKEKAERVCASLRKCRTVNILSDVTYAFRSGEKNRFTVIFNYIRKAVEYKNNDISTAFSLPESLAFFDLKKRIGTEIHRFKGFLRFMESADGYFYACFEPDNDITDLLAPHFKARMKSPFVIHDVKRNVIALCNGSDFKIIRNPAQNVTVYLSEEEEKFRNLWKTYYKEITIEERKNTRLMRAFLPERYWKYLSEKQENIDDF